jgi:AsmA protein
MKRFIKWLAISFAVLILVAVSLPFLINVDQFRPTLQADLSSALGREVSLGNLHLKILSGEVTADDLSVAEDPAFGKPAFIQAKSLHVGVELWPFLFSRKLIVTDLLIDQPEIAAVQAPTGAWNFSTLGGKSKPAAQPSGQRLPLDLSVKLVKITNGRVTLRRTVGHWKPLVLEQANVELRDFSSSSVFPFSLSAQVRGGGNIQLDGKAGPLNPTDSAMTPVSVRLKATQLDLAGSGMNDAMPAIAGIAAFEGTGESDGTILKFQGKLKGEKMKLAQKGTPATRPLELDFSVQHDLRKHSGVIHQGDVHIGGATAHLTGSYLEQGESMVVNLKLSGPGMPVEELEGVLPALAVVLPAGTTLKGGTLSANFSMEGPAERLVVTGSLALNQTRLTGFDLSKKMVSIEKFAGLKAGPDMEIETLSTNLTSSPEGTATHDMKLVVPALGEVTGAGTVSPADQLDFKMSAMVHTTGLMSVVANKPIPFSVTGTASEPVFKPDIGAVAKEEIKSIGKDAEKAAGGLLKGLFEKKKTN